MTLSSLSYSTHPKVEIITHILQCVPTQWNKLDGDNTADTIMSGEEITALGVQGGIINGPSQKRLFRVLLTA